jgi:hypothetical protein
MPYSKSLARRDFEVGANDLKKLAKNVSYKNSPLTYHQKLLIFQSSVFLLSARIEEYSKTLIEGLIYNYQSKSALMSELPENLKTKAIIDSQLTHYKNFSYNSDERKLLERVSCRNPYYEILNPTKPLSPAISSRNILASNKYPSVKNLKILYHRIGIDDIFIEISKRGKKDYKSYLESFLSVREAIAHQVAPTLTNQDVERHISNLSEIIKFIDRTVYSHISKISGSNYWK